MKYSGVGRNRYAVRTSPPLRDYVHAHEMFQRDSGGSEEGENGQAVYLCYIDEFAVAECASGVM